VVDPVDPTISRVFDELERRAADLAGLAIVNGASFKSQKDQSNLISDLNEAIFVVDKPRFVH
jgi:hypothetical protein